MQGTDIAPGAGRKGVEAVNNHVKILYLEDNPQDVSLLRETLLAEGLQVELSAVDTRTAFLQALADAPYDLILADYRVPGFSGPEALSLARAQRPETPFVFVSGTLGEEEAIELMKQGATDYVLKHRLSRLVPALRRALSEAAEQKRRLAADRELQQSNLRLTQVLDSITGLLERLFENTHVLIVHLDAQFNILRVNRAYAEAHQKAPEEYAGQNYFSIYPSEEFQAIFQRVLTRGELYVAKAQALEPLGTAAGHEALWDWSLQPVRNEHGQAEGLLLCLLDVTRHKRAQRARVVSERQYRTLVENVDCIIMRWDTAGNVMFANRFARQFFGYPEGKFARAQFRAAAEAQAHLPDAPLPPLLRDGGPPFQPLSTCESEHMRQEGKRVWMRWTYHAIRDASGRVAEILGVGTDITEHKQRELELQRVQQRLCAFTRTMGTTLHGRAVSPGLAEGKALICLPAESEEAAGHHPISQGEVESEISRFDRALVAAVHELEHLREQMFSNMTDEEMTLIDAHLAMLQDVAFADKCKHRVRDGLIKVEQAVAAEVRDMADVLKGMEREYMWERSADVRDIGRRVLSNLRAVGEPSVNRLKKLPPGTILVAEQLLPSDTLQMDRANVVAFVTERNGPASHVAILARAMGIPAVCDVRKATSLLVTGDRLLVDADAGTVTVAPTRTQTVRFAERRTRHAELAATAAEHVELDCVTQDGVGVALQANIGRPDEAQLVRTCRLDGIGLFRSEFLFLDVDTPPDIEAQAAAYSRVGEIVRPAAVVIRTMDLGGDKMPRFVHEADDFTLRLGKRGLAYSLAEKNLFRTQLQAILRAARQVDVRIMFPMVLGVGDLREARHMVDELLEAEPLDKHVPVGVMIETPSAVFEIREIMELVDFVSIGTNDLAQYILASDRASPELRGVRSFLHPSVLRATAQVVRAASDHAVELSVCGEAAGDPVTACLLVGMGVRKLSMSPFLSNPVRQAIRQLTVEHAESVARDALAATTPQEVEALMSRMLNGNVRAAS